MGRDPSRIEVGWEVVGHRRKLPKLRRRVKRLDELPDRWTAVINPAAGRGRGRSQLPHISDALAAVDADVQIFVSADLADAARIADAAFDDGRGVVACGGDGMVCRLAGIAAEHDGVLAIVPAGSGNDFARHLEIPRDDPVRAAALLRSGRVDRVDLCRAETADGTRAWSTTVANAGFDAEANRWANTIEWAGGTPLYVLATLRTLASFRPRRVRVTVDDDVIETDAWLVAVGNSRSYAGGMMITPDAVLDDGELDVCVVGPVTRATFLRTFPKVFSGTHTANPLVTIRRGKRVAIEMPETLDTAELWASGERVGPLPAQLEAVPAALPRGHRVTPRLLDGERAFHALRTVADDVAVEGVLPGLQVDLLRVRRAAAAHLELEPRLLAVVEHQGVPALHAVELELHDARLHASACRA